MKFYCVNQDYLKYLNEIDNKCIDSIHLIGTILRLNSLIYFLPIDGEDSRDFDSNANLKGTTPAILRIIDMKTNEYLGKCLLSNMFPVPYNEVKPILLSQIKEEHIVLFERKLSYIQKNHKRVMKFAERIYKQKNKEYKQAYLQCTVDFMKLEKACIAWEVKHYGKHVNRFPDSQFFLTNPHTNGITNYYLMNKNRKVALICLDNTNVRVVEVAKIYNKEYAPLECVKNDDLSSEAITSWFKGRGIPSWRDGLDDLLDNLGIENKDVLLNKAFGLSLSDQYWLNPANMRMEWKDINFFDHNFNSQDYVEANFENKLLDLKSIDFFSPNNTSDGMLKKAWIVGSDNKRYMLKGSYRHGFLEPFNEVLASMLASVLGLNHVEYTIEVTENAVLSKCECFINKNTELLSAYAILKYHNIDLQENDFHIINDYITIMKTRGIENVEKELWRMFLLDYLIVNKDRHLGNFGVIRNVENLKWMKIAPNFDSGLAMYSQQKQYEANFKQGEGTFFNIKNVDFEVIYEQIKSFGNLSEIDFTKLYNVADEWKKLLYQYQHITKMEDDEIKSLYVGLTIRVNKLKQII